MNDKPTCSQSKKIHSAGGAPVHSGKPGRSPGQLSAVPRIARRVGARDGVAKSIMKLLFAPSDGPEVKQVRKKLSAAGIRCELRQNPLAQGVFGIPPSPELLIENEEDILKALRLIGARRLRQMTVIFPTP